MNKFLLGLLCAIAVTPSYAYVGYGSNLSGLGYPEFREWEPNRPYTRDESSYEQYRREVEAYVEAAEKYAKNCQADIEDARQKQNNAIDKANRVVEEFNSWVRGY